MSKLLKSELKEIVKECLVEILSEGLSPKKNKITAVSSKRKKKITENKKSRHLDKISYKPKRKSNLKTDLTEDPVMNQIFADTAKSTLQEQVSADSRRPMNSQVMSQGDQAAKIVNKNSPEDLFGQETADKWASLAFL